MTRYRLRPNAAPVTNVRHFSPAANTLFCPRAIGIARSHKNQYSSTSYAQCACKFARPLGLANRFTKAVIKRKVRCFCVCSLLQIGAAPHGSPRIRRALSSFGRQATEGGRSAHAGGASGSRALRGAGSGERVCAAGSRSGLLRAPVVAGALAPAPRLALPPSARFRRVPALWLVRLRSPGWHVPPLRTTQGGVPLGVATNGGA